MPATPTPDPAPAGSERLRLPRRRIVRRRAVFDAAFARGRRYSGRALTLIVLLPPLPAPDAGEAAFLTPKRLGGAVLRNRLRRRLREAYRLHRAHFLAARAEGRRLIWLAKPPATALDFAELVQHMKDLYDRSLRG